MMVVHEQLAADLVQFILAEEEIILKPVLAQGTIDRMGIDLGFIAQHGQGLLCPGTIEDGFVQHLQILLCHIVFAVDEVCFCQALDHPRTLVVVGDGLHGLEGKALGGVDESEIEVDLS